MDAKSSSGIVFTLQIQNSGGLLVFFGFILEFLHHLKNKEPSLSCGPIHNGDESKLVKQP